MDIKVCARLRPMNQKQQFIDSYAFQQLTQITLKLKQNGNILYNNPDGFSYDRVFGPNATQSQIYDFVGNNILQKVFQGLNGTIFTYGQTSSGKTYTCFGDLNNQQTKGLVPRLSQNIFNKISLIGNKIEFSIKISIVQIYLQKIKDLIDIKKNDLKLKQSKSKGIFIQDVTQIYVSNQNQLNKYIKIAHKNRTLAKTNMNQQSSRSHMIVLLQIYQNNRIQMSAKNSKLVIVDLAGSQSVSKTGAQGKVLEEAKQINKSLVTLGMVINSLSQKKISHTPYRDSKLTRFLQDSLGGNACTNLIINISPCMSNYGQILNTLRFGQRVKKVKNKPKVNREYTVGELMILLQRSDKIIKQRQEYIKQLQRKLGNGIRQQIQLAPPPPPPPPPIRLIQRKSLKELIRLQQSVQLQKKVDQRIKDNEINKLKEQLIQIDKIYEQQIQKLLKQNVQNIRQLDIQKSKHQQTKNKLQLLENRYNTQLQNINQLKKINTQIVEKCNQLQDNNIIFKNQIQKYRFQVQKLNSLTTSKINISQPKMLQSYSSAFRYSKPPLSTSFSIVKPILPLKLHINPQISIQQLKKHISQLQQQIKAYKIFKQQKQKFQRQIQENKLELKNLYNDLEEKLDKIQQLQLKVENEKRQKDALLEIVSKLDEKSKIKKIVDLQNKLKQLSGEILIIKNEQSKWLTQNEMMAKQLQRKSDRIQQLQSQLLHLQQQNEILQMRYEQIVLNKDKDGFIIENLIKRQQSLNENNIIKYINSDEINIKDVQI